LGMLPARPFYISIAFIGLLIDSTVQSFSYMFLA
jgi:hypothetical protein